MNQAIEKLSPVILLLARVVIGYMFLLHGTAKFFEFPMSMTGGNGSVPLFSIYGVGGIIEIVGGLFTILGLFTRPTAFLLAGQMAYAYFFMHMTADTIFDPLTNKGELAVMYCMAFLILLVTGAGKLSLDAKLNNK
ncbi:DoxX family protein, possible membrane protein [Actinobacillus minor 202]|uniref:DoxX family protein n=2 Tax=Actinobacillus TaxID=713 RepID=A0A2U8FII7_9PAST|nr:MULTISPECIES: DoxX family protein [Actinobacillus]AWI50810.1 DoxX family protein [Actinobacillus porcitonsillarum]EEV24855.1 DoxX family protein, possible membrane protein [Actinobacillus minor 202]